MIAPHWDILRQWDVNATDVKTLHLHPHVMKVMDGKRTYYLKKREDSSIENCLEEYHLSSYLLNNGLHVETPILTSSQRPFVKDGKQIYSLYEELEGTPLTECSITSFGSAGANLSTLHLLLKEYRSTYEIRAWDIARHVKEWMSELETTPIGKRGKDLLSRMEGWESYYDRLPVQLVHSDYHRGNILMKGNDVSGIIDFARIRTAPRITDIAYFLAGLLKDNEKVDRENYFRSKQLFVGGYGVERHLTGLEKRMLPIVIILFLLQYAFLYDQKGYAEKGLFCVSLIDEILNQV
ncbi:phosphotransferase enzyme family protein [Rossellomorea aquimaris]|uniref:phosphotransferase enzyme family protein n=1 Tax=Rossellomorea aquimaris TaxID=189382 RepID=UPI001CFCDD36|nr:phosphotransferase [Rossellomorea aquimaris]